VLGLDPERGIDIRQALHDLGLDSLRALDLRNALAASIGSGDLAPTLLFDYPTVEALARHLAERMPATMGAAQEAAATAAPDELAALERIERLSDQEVEALLRERLASPNRSASPGKTAATETEDA
jgi:hypothetical protein